MPPWPTHVTDQEKRKRPGLPSTASQSMERYVAETARVLDECNRDGSAMQAYSCEFKRVFPNLLRVRNQSVQVNRKRSRSLRQAVRSNSGISLTISGRFRFKEIRPKPPPAASPSH